MLRVLKILEWRRLLKQYEREGRPVIIHFESFENDEYFRVKRVGWLLVEVELLDRVTDKFGPERYTFAIEEVMFLARIREDDVILGLLRRYPDLASLPLRQPLPEDELEEDETLEDDEEIDDEEEDFDF